MTVINGWPGKPGVPANPERDGWHWCLSPLGDDLFPCFWRAAGETSKLQWPAKWQYRRNFWNPKDCTYLGPCLTPDEVQNLRDDLASAERERAHQQSRADRNAAEHAREQAKREALQKRVAELETALQFIKDAPDEERKPNWNNMGSYEAGLRYCAAFARAAMEGWKDE